jgi:hypothetical protein
MNLEFEVFPTSTSLEAVVLPSELPCAQIKSGAWHTVHIDNRALLLYKNDEVTWIH